MTHPINHQALSQFTGSESLYYNPVFGKYRYTEGVQYLGAHGASWLITDILAFQRQPAVCDYARTDWFQLWRLKVADDQSATLVCEDGNNRVLFSHSYRYTDFPLPEITLYLCDNTLLLPSEY